MFLLDEAGLYACTWSSVKGIGSGVFLCVSPSVMSSSLRPHGLQPRQKYWCGQPFPSPGDPPDPGMAPWSPALQGDSLPSHPLEKPKTFLALANPRQNWLGQLGMERAQVWGCQKQVPAGSLRAGKWEKGAQGHDLLRPHVLICAVLTLWLSFTFIYKNFL